MKLPFSFPFGKKEKSQYFLSLLLRDEKANAVIFEEIEGKAHVIGEHEEHFNDSIETASIEDWLEVLDKAISAAESSLPPNIETQKTIFGVKENWIEDGKIKREYLIRLKKVSDVLGLEPIGFLVIHEAIVHLLSEKEGVPVSAILVELGRSNIAVSLLRAGRIIETKRTELKDSISATTDRILHHFTQYEILPSRIIVFNGKDHEELSQEFIGHTWSKNLPFLHVPQITTLPNGFDARAVLFGAATQMGFELLGGVSVSEDSFPKREQVEKKNEEKVFAKEEGITEGPQIIKETLENIPDREISMEEFGFVRDTDIAKPIKKAEVLDDTVTSVMPEKSDSLHAKQYNLEGEEEQEEELTKDSFTTPQRTHRSAPVILSLLLALLKRPIAFFTSLSLPRFSGKRRIMLLPPILVLAGIGILLLYIFFLKATITLTISPKVVEHDQLVALAAGQPSDFEKGIIQVEGVFVSEDGSVTTPATGKREIGEKAKGTITILSSLTKEQTFSAGVTVRSSNGLLFVLDNDVKIASSSGLSDLKSTKASVTAKNIGKEYNLPSGTKFSVGTFDASQVEAKNDTAFSGGSKKEVTVVSKTDVDKLLAELPSDLEEKAKKDIEAKVANSKELVPGLIKTTISKRELSNEIGEETTSVGLKGTVTYDAFTYDKDSLTGFSKNVTRKEDTDLIPSDNGITYEFKDVKESKDKITATLHIVASLVPKMKEKELKEALSGKTFDEAKIILEKIGQVKSVDIVLQPQLPFLPALLPKKADNIIFAVKTND